MAGTGIFGVWPKVSSIVAACFCDGATPPVLSRQGGLNAFTGAVRNGTGSFTLTLDTTKTGPLTAVNVQVTCFILPLGNNVVAVWSVTSPTTIGILLQDTAGAPVDAGFNVEISRR
jgi:hypothetical protein